MGPASRVAVVIGHIVVGLLLVAAPAEARGSNPNGWSAGGSSNEVSGHVGASRPAPKPASKRPGPVKVVASRKKAAPRPKPPQPTGAETADSFVLPPPTIVANPAEVGLVGVESRFWATVPGLVVRDIEAGGVSAHVEARPAALVWDSGDGAAGETRAGEAGMPLAADPVGGIGFTYGRDGTYVVRCTVRWDVRWSSSDGGSGAIPDRSSAGVHNYKVEELRSVLTPLGNEPERRGASRL